ncbi:MAG: chorismate-binding protein [Bdellovibrionaceae bacterium]|nr:chorismate-binding protein [Pseudobdellovibrionaceae bacterium]
MTTAMAPNYTEWKSQGAVYGAGRELTLFWGKAAEFSVNDQYPAVFSNDFFLTNQAPWTQYQKVSHVSTLAEIAQVPQNLAWQTPDHVIFKKHFQRAQKKLHEGSITKIVLATETRAPKSIAPDIFLSNALGMIPQNTHVYGQWSQEQGFIGFTPEILFKTTDGKII